MTGVAVGGGDVAGDVGSASVLVHSVIAAPAPVALKE